MSQQAQQTQPARRRRAYVSIWGTTQMHLRSPVIIGFWSAIFPGMGHLLLSKYIRGFILFVWEIVINLMAHLNLSIFYTFTGEFELAKQVLDLRWLMLYIPVYLFTIWDSYRTATDLNNQFVLAAREDAEVRPFVLHPLGLNYLDKTSPWTTVVWSMITPGAGQIIIHRIVVAFFLVAWWTAVVYFSRVLPAIHQTALGMFEKAKTIVDPQWLLNIPSLYFFGIYDAYTNAVESNNLYQWEQAKFLRRQYQNAAFPIPLRKRSDKMYIVSNFEYSNKLEMAITAIEKKGIPKQDILAVPMDKKADDKMLVDRTHSSDSVSMFDVPMILAALFALFGLIYGFLLEWGPILWALIGTGAGFGVGVLIKLYTMRKRKAKQQGKTAEVVLIVACDESRLQMVQDTLWAHAALGVAKLDID